MSDLIKKIRSKAKNTVCDGEYSVKLTLDGKEIETILSALETVWGIEELSKCGFVRIENGIMNQWHVTTNREWRSDQQETDAPILSAAVEAARKGM